MLVTESPLEIEKEFLDSVYLISHSKKTVQTYHSGINHFRKFVSLKYPCNEFELFSKIKSDEIPVYHVIRDFVIYLDQKQIRPRGMRSYLSGLKGYFRHVGIRINSDDFKQLVKIPKIVKTREIPVTKDMIVRILHNSSSKLQTAILICSSSGLRIGELVQLKLSDVDFTSIPTQISVRSEIAKGSMSRDTFISSEATRALQDYLKRYFGWKEESSNSKLQNVLIFWRISKAKDADHPPTFSLESAKQALQVPLRKQIEKIPELDIRNENGLRAVHFHAFRKFFRTTVGNAVGRDFAEALMGHGFYMDTYYQLPEEKKKLLYLQAESHLTISDFKVVEKDMKVLSTKYQNLENKVDDLMSYLRTNSIDVPDFLKQ